MLMPFVAAITKIAQKENLAADYAARVATAGGSVSLTNQDRIASILASIKSVGELENGWLFGNEWNATLSQQVNLVEGKPSLVPIGTTHVDSNLSSGMMHLRLQSAGNGFRTVDNSGLFSRPATASERYSVLVVGQYFGDNTVGLWSAQSAPTLFSQHTNTSTNGNIACTGSGNGPLQFVEWGGGGLSGGSVTADRDAAVEPIVMWWTCDENAATRIYHAGDGTTFLNQTMAGDPAGRPFRLGELVSGVPAANVGNFGVVAILKVKGSLSDANRKAIFDTVMANWRQVGYPTHITGNSVTQAAAVVNSLNSMDAMPRQVMKWGLRRGMLTLRIADGGRRIPRYCPTGYAQPPNTPLDTDIASRPINNYTWLRPRLWINHEQQNYTTFNAGTVNGPISWASWKHAHDAIVAHLQANGSPDLRCVCFTQMAVAPYKIALGEHGVPHTYADFVNTPGRANLLAISDAMKAETNWICPTAIADLYYTRQVPGGWVGEANPNLPRGDETKFHSNADRSPPLGTSPYPGCDPQHSNKAGHDQETLLAINAASTLFSL